jgi:hypothetical protein
MPRLFLFANYLPIFPLTIAFKQGTSWYRSFIQSCESPVQLNPVRVDSLLLFALAECALP